MRRGKFIESIVWAVGGLTFPFNSMAKKKIKTVRFGIVTDIHYAEAPDNVELNRYYRQSDEKMAEFAEAMNEQDVDFVIELGDLKDQGNPPKEADTLEFLRTIEKILQKFKGPVYHVLGNHDHDSISKRQFLENISNDGFKDALNYYSFTKKGFHFIVLDANYESSGKEYNHGNFDWTDAYLPEEQISWLKKDLRQHDEPTIVFIHHQLDTPLIEDKRHCVSNADVVRKILEESGNVSAVFQGHYHKGSVNRIKGIHYYTLKALVDGSGVENNNYAVVETDSERRIKIKGFRRTESQEMLPV